MTKDGVITLRECSFCWLSERRLPGHRRGR